MVEYAWRQPDGEMAPILSTEGYELMMRIGEDWGWTPPGAVGETFTNGYVIAQDAYDLAVKRVGNTVPRDELSDLARWFYDELLRLARRGEPQA